MSHTHYYYSTSCNFFCDWHELQTLLLLHLISCIAMISSADTLKDCSAYIDTAPFGRYCRNVEEFFWELCVVKHGAPMGPDCEYYVRAEAFKASVSPVMARSIPLSSDFTDHSDPEYLTFLETFLTDTLAQLTLAMDPTIGKAKSLLLCPEYHVQHVKSSTPIKLCAIVRSLWEFNVDLCEDLFTMIALMSHISNIYADHVVFDCLASVLIEYSSES